MAGIGKFKLSDALPKTQASFEEEVPGAVLGGKNTSKAKPKSKKATKGKAQAPHEQAAEQVREARESTRARNNEASIRGHMVDIGRGNQQAGRQKAK